MEWDNVFTISECKWGAFLFIPFFITCVYEIGNLFTADIVTSMNKNKFGIFAFYLNVINSISPDVFRLSLLCFEYLFDPKPECYMLIEISYMREIWKFLPFSELTHSGEHPVTARGN